MAIGVRRTRVHLHPNAGIGAAGKGERGRQSTFKKLTIFDLEKKIAGKKVLIRCDFNSTAKNGKIVDATRIDAALPTLRHVLRKRAAKVYLISHNGRNEQIVKDGEGVYTLEPVREYLSNALGLRVDFKGFDRPVVSGDRVVLMENTRVDARDEAKDSKLNEAYAKQILSATNPDIYVLDGFSVGHRDQGSVTWLAKLMKREGKPAVAGHLLYKEYEFFIDKVINHPEKPFLVFLGGSKVADKLPILKALLPNVDRIVIGGAMAFPFMLAKEYKVEGMDPLAKRKDREKELKVETKIAREVLQKYESKVEIPTLVVSQNRDVVEVSQGSIPEGIIMRDIMITEITQRLESVGYRTIFFNGTFGAYEQKWGGHVAGTNAVLKFMSGQTEKGALTIPGGGDTITVLKGLKKTDKVKFSHETTGGGASGKLITLGFAGKPEEFPGFACLTDK